MNWDNVIQESKTDALLAGLVDEVQEYAQIYLLAKQRHKGCEGTGELMTLREEFRDEIEKLGKYCREKGCPCDINTDDPDTAARVLTSRAMRR